MNWYYIEAARRVGPLNETEWAQRVQSGAIRRETLVWHDGMGDRWVPLDQLPPPEPPDAPEPPEEDEALLEEPEEAPEAFAARMIALDYKVDLDACMMGAWECFRAHFWPLIAATFCAMGLVFMAKLLPLLEMLLGGVILGGLFLLCLRLMRGIPAGINDLLEGFKPPLLKPLALQTLVNALVWKVCFIPVILAMQAMGLTEKVILAGYAAGNLEGVIDPQASLVLLLVMLTCSLPAVYFSFCWIFSIPLIVDKGMPFWPAMQLSRHKVMQHPWRVSLLLILAGLLGGAGALFFFVGGFLTLPLYFLMVLHLYEAIFNPAPPPKAE